MSALLSLRRYEREREDREDRLTVEEVAPILPPGREPIPTGIDRVKEAAPKGVRAGGLAMSLYQPMVVGELTELDPVVQALKQPEHADDPSGEDYSAPLSWSKGRGVQSRSSAMPFTNFDWPVPQRRVGLHPSLMHFLNERQLLGDESETRTSST